LLVQEIRLIDPEEGSQLEVANIRNLEALKNVKVFTDKSKELKSI